MDEMKYWSYRKSEGKGDMIDEGRRESEREGRKREREIYLWRKGYIKGRKESDGDNER